MIYGTFSFAIVLNILLSNEPPEISFIIWAPELTDSLATLLLYVSTEIIAFGNLFEHLFLYSSLTAIGIKHCDKDKLNQFIDRRRKVLET